MFCDISKVYTGFGVIPKVTQATNDKDWGEPNSSKKVFVSKILTQKGGFVSIDHIIERIENGYWKTTEIKPNEILVEYTYHHYSNNFILFPFNCFFAKKI
ncbi:MAG: hypothetical protein ACI8ZX_001159 [Planctomycetota bacterium]|jgi:hypothetical protein